MRAMVSMVGMRSCASINRIIGRERFVNAASRFNENPFASRRCLIAFANASHTGSSAVRGNGLFAENGTVFQNLIAVGQRRDHSFLSLFPSLSGSPAIWWIIAVTSPLSFLMNVNCAQLILMKKFVSDSG